MCEHDWSLRSNADGYFFRCMRCAVVDTYKPATTEPPEWNIGPLPQAMLDLAEMERKARQEVSGITNLMRGVSSEPPEWKGEGLTVVTLELTFVRKSCSHFVRARLRYLSFKRIKRWLGSSSGPLPDKTPSRVGTLFPLMAT